LNAIIGRNGIIEVIEHEDIRGELMGSVVLNDIADLGKVITFSESERTILRGEIYMAEIDDLSLRTKHLMKKNRPVYIIQKDSSNLYSDTVVVAVISSQERQKKPYQYCFNNKYKPNTILFEQILTIDKSRLKEKIWQLDEEEIKQADEILVVQLGLNYLSYKSLQSINVKKTERIRTRDSINSNLYFDLNFNTTRTVTMKIDYKKLNEFIKEAEGIEDFDVIQEQLDNVSGLNFLTKYSELIVEDSIAVKEKSEQVRRGDIFKVDLTDLSVGTVHIPSRVIYILIVQNDMGNKYSPTVEGAVITPNTKKDYPTHYKITMNGIEYAVAFERIITIDKERLGEKVSSLSYEQQCSADLCLCNQFNLHPITLQNVKKIDLDKIYSLRTRTKEEKELYFKVRLMTNKLIDMKIDISKVKDFYSQIDIESDFEEIIYKFNCCKGLSFIFNNATLIT
jgi:mRNA interferase MazF